jgi:hypothetical protein
MLLIAFNKTTPWLVASPSVFTGGQLLHTPTNVLIDYLFPILPFCFEFCHNAPVLSKALRIILNRTKDLIGDFCRPVRVISIQDLSNQTLDLFQHISPLRFRVSDHNDSM